jgi:glycosyltransferase involved in cell wall biosynthesis
MSEKLAQSYARRLTYDVTHVVVQQNLLPFLWQAGVLGGRTFDVLMTALPIKDLQKRLDLAAHLHPDSKTLADFRADDWLLKAENEALQNARNIVTPHTEIAALFPRNSILLEWKMFAPQTKPKTKNDKFTIIFPASTVGRKGAYELRQALRNLKNVKLIAIGAQLEGANFWDGFDVEHLSPKANWLEKADLVVLPAFVEHKPRRLLMASACGVPVIASKACGIENVSGVTTVDCGAADLLRENIIEAMNKRNLIRGSVRASNI